MSAILSHNFSIKKITRGKNHQSHIPGLIKVGTHVDINHHLVLQHGAMSDSTVRYVTSFSTLDHSLDKTVEVVPFCK